MAQPYLPVWSKQDVIVLVQQALRRQIELFRRGRCRLHIPLMPASERPDPSSRFLVFPELRILLVGSIVFRFSHLPLRVTSPQMCLIPPLTPHSPRQSTDRFRLLVITSYQGRLSVILCDTQTERDPMHRPRPSVLFTSPGAGRIEQHFNDIAAHSRPGGNRLAMRGLLLAVLAEMLEVVQGPADEHLGHYKVAQVKMLIRDRINDESLSIPRLAQWAHCSSDYLSRLFHSTTGVRLAKYINKQRIAHACHLLDTSSLNIAETAIACGFSDPGYFTRVFRNEVGKTPMQYRRLPKRRS